MAALVDASGVELALDRPPRRIVSLIPSTTETLCALGLADALVGVTVYCREPVEITRTKTKIGGEKNPDLATIRALEPDLVVANVEENVRAHIDQLRAWAIPVWVTYPRTVADGLRLIRELGEVTGTGARRGRGACAGGGLLCDLARPVHDGRRRHVRPRHAHSLRR
jgi:ABC-type Fe3+-hydroxamate transport system substrate-binding protein